MASLGRSTKTLADPTKGDDQLSEALGRLQGEFANAIGELRVVPIHGGKEGNYCGLHEAARLPGRFRDDFGRRPLWHPDLLFGKELVQEQTLGKRGVEFLRWLGSAREVSANDVRWAQTVPTWWSVLEDELPNDVRTDALFALWHGLDDREWHEASSPAPGVATRSDSTIPERSMRQPDTSQRDREEPKKARRSQLGRQRRTPVTGGDKLTR